MSVMMTFSFVGFSFADEGTGENPATTDATQAVQMAREKPEAPSKPEVVDYNDNDKIVEYNNQAEDYNKKVDEYNEQVDKDYDEAVEETSKKNEEINQHNDSENARVEAETAENEEIAKENQEKKETAEANKEENDRIKAEAEEKANEINAKIDKDYEEAVEAEQARVAEAIEHNKAEQEKIDEVVAYNEAEQARVDEINQELREKYEQDLAIYNEKMSQNEVAEEVFYGGSEEDGIVVKRGSNNKADIVTSENGSTTYNYRGDNKRYVNFSLITTIGYTTTGTDWDNNAAMYSNKVYGTIADLNDITQAPLTVKDEGEGRNLINYKTNDMGLEACDSMIRNMNTEAISNYFNSNNGQEEAGNPEAMISFKDFPSDAQVFKNLQTNGTVFVDPETGKKYKGEEINPETFDICWFSVKYQANGWRVSGVLLKDGVIVMPEEPTYEEANLKEVPEGDFWDETTHEVVKEPYVTPESQYSQELKDELYEETSLKDIIPADMWELLPDPIKDSYLAHIDLMDLFEVPAPVVEDEPEAPAEPPKGDPVVDEPEQPVVDEPTEPEQPVVEEEPTEPPYEEQAVEEEPEVVPTTFDGIVGTAKPQRKASVIPGPTGFVEVAYAETEPELLTSDIDDEAVPLATKMFDSNDGNSWALINLLAMLFTVIFTVILIGTAIYNSRNRDAETTIENKDGVRVIAAIISVATIIAFFLTENMSGDMVMTDEFTLLMIGFVILQGAFSLLSIHESSKKEM